MANKDKLLESAQKFLAKGQIAKAIGEYQKLVEAFPKDFRNRQKLAELLSREKRNVDAQPHYEAVARNFSDTGFYLKAIAIYKQMQKIEPDRVDIYLRLAELNEKQGLIGNALNEYRNLIAFYDKNRMERESVGVLQKMIALDPENLGFRGKLIETLVAVHEEAEALEQLRNLISFLATKGEPAKVVKLYEKFLDLCPDDVEYRLPLGEALLASGQADKALVLLKALLKQTPDHPTLLAVLADCHLALGNHADARLTCQHLLKERPQDLSLRERYIRICIEGGDSGRALESLEEAQPLFCQADRIEVFRELCESLRSSIQGDARQQAILAGICAATGGEAEPVVFADDGAAEIVAGEGVIEAGPSRPAEGVEAHAVEVPSAVEPAPLVPDSQPKSGLELELDLDLDLDLGEPTAAPPASPSGPAAVLAPTTVAPMPVAPAAPPVQPVAPAPESTPALDMELELDLGGLDEISFETAAEIVTPIMEPESLPLPDAGTDAAAVAIDATTPAPEGEELVLPDLDGLEFETVPVEPVAEDREPEFPLEVEETAEFESTAHPEAVAAEAVTPSGEEPALSEFGELEFEIGPDDGLRDFSEKFPEAEVAGGEPEYPPAPAEVLPVDTGVLPALAEPTESAGLAPEEYGFAFELPEATSAEQSREPDEFDEIEELEELEVVEESQGDEDFEELEELEDIEEVGEDEVFEALDELEELDEFEEPAVEPGSVPVEVAPVGQRLRDDLEEAEFYLRQGLIDDAERLLLAIRQNHGEIPEAAAMQAEIGSQRETAAATGEKDAIFELMADIKESELLGAADFLAEPADGESDEFTVSEAAEDDEDAQSHFDLGIAYKEMGLLDDAIAEFGKAQRDPHRRLDCITLKGQCLAELGEPGKAEAAYREGLTLPGLTEEGMVALQYELGLLYEALERPAEALESFRVVADRDLFYRDVTEKLRYLRQKLGIDDQAIESVSEAGSGRDRISFV